MSLKEADRLVMVTLHLEKVDKTLHELEVQVRNELWPLVANRLYYALFHAVSALLISEGHEVGTHRGAVGKFSLYYVKAGTFTGAEGHLYARLQQLRESGDYNCSIDVEKGDVEPFIEPAQQLIGKIRQYIAEHENCQRPTDREGGNGTNKC